MSGPEPLGSTSTSRTDYPVQRHAGKVGYGPNYNAGASFGDRVSGLYEEVKGHFTHNPDLIRHGHERFTGEQKRRELLGETNDDPVFEQGHDEGKKRGPAADKSSTSTSAVQPHGQDSDLPKVNKDRKEAAPASTSDKSKGSVFKGKAKEHAEHN